MIGDLRKWCLQRVQTRAPIRLIAKEVIVTHFSRDRDGSYFVGGIGTSFLGVLSPKYEAASFGLTHRLRVTRLMLAFWGWFRSNRRVRWPRCGHPAGSWAAGLLC